MLALQAFIVLLLAFLLVDLIAWTALWGSMTQVLIAAQRRDRVFRLLLIAVIVAAACFLVVHFELIGG
jgi:hypothetical protein